MEFRFEGCGHLFLQFMFQTCIMLYFNSSWNHKTTYDSYRCIRNPQNSLHIHIQQLILQQYAPYYATQQISSLALKEASQHILSYSISSYPFSSYPILSTSVTPVARPCTLPLKQHLGTWTADTDIQWTGGVQGAFCSSLQQVSMAWRYVYIYIQMDGYIDRQIEATKI